MGGIDWAGLPVVVELLGITDPAAVINRLQVIKSYRPEQPEAPTED